MVYAFTILILEFLGYALLWFVGISLAGLFWNRHKLKNEDGSRNTYVIKIILSRVAFISLLIAFLQCNRAF
jgi:hypothetical protein